MDPIRLALGRAASEGLMFPGSSILLAVSGGADSMALLYGAAEAAASAGWRLAVGHVHHGWRGREADRDLHFVEEHARRMGLPFASRRCDARAASRTLGLSPEAGARFVRYPALHEIARELGAARIATAHQQDDVLESHLLGTHRGAGIALLAGPREQREDGVVRPLLTVPRAFVLHFLADRGLTFRRDASNGDRRLLRTRAREEVAAMSVDERRRLTAEVGRLRALRERIEREIAERILPRVRFADDAVSIDAGLFADTSDEIRRAALERLAAPFARPGRPPMTGREREQILRRLSSDADFRFEAGRRIRFERRRGILTVRAAPGAPVYHSRIEPSAKKKADREVAR